MIPRYSQFVDCFARLKVANKVPLTNCVNRVADMKCRLNGTGKGDARTDAKVFRCFVAARPCSH